MPLWTALKSDPPVGLTVPSGDARWETTIKRSRFISQAWRVGSRREAEERIAAVWQEHPQARHVVYAFVVGSRNSQLMGMSDDGEPRGTAGRPVLEILKGNEITDCLITVVRYFGGIKLGTGGLVHAYGDAARGVLAELPVEQRRTLEDGELCCSYDLLAPVEAVLAELNAEVRDVSYAAKVCVHFGIEKEAIAKLQRRLQDVSRGTLKAAFSRFT